MERIVQGALRLAAHRLLGEEPHFEGGSGAPRREEGIASIERATKPPEPPKPANKARSKKASPKRIIGERLRTDNPAPGRRKPWSARNTRSYRDPQKDDE